MDPAKLKVVELRSELSKRGLDTKGNKAALVERLRQALEDEPEARPEENSENESSSSEDDASRSSRRAKEKTPESSRLPPRTPSRATRNTAAVAAAVVAPKTPTRSTQRATATKIQEKPNEAVPTAEEPPVKKPKFDEKPAAVTPPATTAAAPPSTPEKSPKKVEPSPVKLAPKEVETVVVSPKKSPTQSAVIAKVPDENVNKSPRKLSESLTKSANKSIEIEDSHKIQNICNLPPRQSPTKPSNLTEPAVVSKPVNVSKIVQTPKPVPIQAPKPVPTETSKPAPTQTPKLAEVPKPVEQQRVNIPQDVCKKQESLPAKKMENSQVVQEKKEDKKQEKHKVTDVPKVEVKVPSQKESKSEPMEVTVKKKIQEKDTKIQIEKVSEKIVVEPEKSREEAKKDPQDVSKKEVKKETEAKVKSEDKPEQNDRKRKRSASPQDESALPVSRLEPDDDPEIDDNAVLLSWYDSDLNLIIEKNGFVSATPMHNDGFGYVWAGARASFGFNSGKVFYETKILEHCSINIQDEINPHVVRVGWSVKGTSMQLGEEKLGYAYSGTGKKSTGCKFEDYGIEFSQGDIISSYLDITDEKNVMISFAVNGKHLGTAFTVTKQELQNKALFPHMLTKNCTFACNFGQEDRWSEQVLEGYTFVGLVDLKDRIAGPRRPQKKGDCEVIMMCGLPGVGKTVWSLKHSAEHPEKMYNILGTSTLIDKMKVLGLPRKKNYHGRWEVLITMCTRALNVLLDKAYTRRRNYIIDQTNVYPSAQKRKIRNFVGFQRKITVIVPTDEDFKARILKREEVDGKEVPDSAVLEMKANFNPPTVGEFFNSVEWPELDEHEARKLIEQYNKEGRNAGFGLQSQQNKRARIDSQKDNRDSRSNRDSHRRGGYSDRNRSTSWRGGSNSGGWRDNRPIRGGHMRHGPPGGWRPRGPPPLAAHRGAGDRRTGAGGDRRLGNDRIRSVPPRSGGWGQSGSYQGQQASGSWNTQGAWSSGQSSGWNQSGWGNPQQWGNWKGYGQGSYNATNYNQQNYDNGNYSGWNQQYYNQYWGQPQQSGQTTAAGSQAVNATGNTTTTSSISNTASNYSFSQDWQDYSQTYTYPNQNYATSSQGDRQLK